MLAFFRFTCILSFTVVVAGIMSEHINAINRSTSAIITLNCFAVFITSLINIFIELLSNDSRK